MKAIHLLSIVAMTVGLASCAGGAPAQQQLGQGSPPPAAPPGPFISTGSIGTTRIYHTAIRLGDGRVLVSGGSSTYPIQAALATAEIYDPSSATFTATGNMITARGSHSATLLQDGRVLIAGGWSCSNQDCTDLQAVDPVELYDPTTGTFTATGPMVSSHSAMNAILLGNGKVLFLAGNQQDGSATAEVYDPASGTFAIAGTGEMFRGPTAVLLQNGKALLAGSAISESEDLPRQFELFDPATGNYTLTSTDSTLVQDGTGLTVLKNGKVLVAGGQGEFEQVEAGLYDPSTETIASTGNIIVPRENSFTATLLDNGKVLFAGGVRGVNAVGSAEFYDPTVGAFSGAGNMVLPRFGHTATLLNNGKVLITGGLAGLSQLTVTATAELYVPLSP